MMAGIAQRGRTFLAVFAAISMVLSLMSVYAMPADADHVAPEEVDGNPDCESLDSSWLEVKADPPNAGTYTDGTLEVTVTRNGDFFSWSSNLGVDAVIAKGGPDANAYYYSPEATSDSDLVAPTNPNNGRPFGLSHISFCYDEDPVPSDPGEIIVEKEVTDGSDTSQEFDFTASYDADGFSLADGEDNESGDLDAGDYEVTETVPSGWTLESATCDNGDDPDSIDLGEGDTVTCTFVNDEDPVPSDPGEIIVEKEVTDGSDTSQEFDFTASYDADGFSLADGEDNESGDLDAGDYEVTEDVPSGWTLDDVVCESDGNSTTGDITDGVEIDLAAGDTVTCTFTNDERRSPPPPPSPEPGEIIVEKEVTDGSDTSQEFDFSASYDDDGFSLADGEDNESGDLDAGDYSVTEDVPDGWTLESASCDNGDDPDDIELDEGDTVTCTFVNDEDPEPGEIIVQKLVQSEDDPQDFAFTFDTVGFDLADNTLAHGESSSSGDLDAGNYSVSEQQVNGWTQVSATCDEGETPDSIDLEAGETVTCTFVNTIGTEVGASIVVNVSGTCEVNDDDEGEGIIDVDISVDDGAEVVINDSDGDVIDTLSTSGTVTVAEGATYSWEATPNEGFEFPVGSETSGTITIETCSDPETLPFTGIDTGMMALMASTLMAGGLLLLNTVGRREES